MRVTLAGLWTIHSTACLCSGPVFSFNESARQGASVKLAVCSMPFESKEKNHQVDDEQQHDRHFQDQHPAVGLVMIQQLIEIIQGFQFPVHRSVPIAQMKSRRNVFVNASQVPIAKELADIG